MNQNQGNTPRHLPIFSFSPITIPIATPVTVLMAVASIVGASMVGATMSIADARPAPDATLGEERSQVIPQGEWSDRIEGGAIRGANLFHSFSEFGVDDGRSVYFGNPVGIERILSRVTGPNGSNIFGTLGVDGTADLFLLNPNGIVFGPNARLDIAGSFVASTADRILFADNQTFSAVEPELPPLLTINVPTGLQYGSQHPAPLINAGALTVGPDQTITLAAGSLLNTGTVDAPGGHVSLAAVPGNSVVALGHTGELLTWSTGANPFEPVRSQPSSPTLTELLHHAGLDPTSEILAGVDLAPGTALISGQINTADMEQLGGTIQLLGHAVHLSAVEVNASGPLGGGQINIGGNYQGQGPLPNAAQITINPTAAIHADALTTGDGGTVIAWADDTANIHGVFTARGGEVSGNGGLIETSGLQRLNLTSTPDASAPQGENGLWLIDPTDIIIDASGDPGTMNVNTVNTALNSGTDVTITTNSGGTDEGNITQNASIQKTAGGEATLRMEAANNIIINQDITSSSGQLNIELRADSDSSNVGHINIADANIDTNGGDFTGFSYGNPINDGGLSFLIERSNLNANGGNISLLALGQTNTTNRGILLEESQLSTAGNGSISLDGRGGTVGDLTIGIDIVDFSTVSTEDGDIQLVGTGSGINDGWGVQIRDGSTVRTTGRGNINIQGISNGNGVDNYGIRIREQNFLGLNPSPGPGVIEALGSGSITLDGQAGNGTNSNTGILIEQGGRVTANSGSISLNGTSGIGISDNNGVRIDGSLSRVRTENGDIFINGNAGASNGHVNHGVYILDGLVQANGVGNIQISGTSEATTNDIFGNEGIALLQGRIESTGVGSIEMTGVSGISGANVFESDGNQGIYIQDTAINSADGDITLRGTGRGVGDNHYGIWNWSGSDVIQAGGAGNVTLEGRVVGADNNSVGLYLIDGGTIATTGTGNITLTANDIALREDSQRIRGFNRLQLQPLDPGGDITVGDTNSGAGSGDRLNLNPSELAQIADTFTQLVIGRDDGSGEITVLANTFNQPTVIQAPTMGGSILVEGAIATNSHALTLNAGDMVAIENDIRTGDGRTGDGRTGDGDLTIQGGQINQSLASTIIGRNISLLSTDGDILLNTLQANNLNIESARAVEIRNNIRTDDGDLTIQGSQINQSLASTIIGRNISLLSTDGDILLNTLQANNLNIESARAVEIRNDIRTGNGNLSIQGSQIRQASASSITSGDLALLSTSGDITLNHIQADTLTVESAGGIIGNGLLNITGDASFISNLANAGSVSVTNTQPSTIGYSIIGGNFSLNSATPITQALGEPLQVAGDIVVNGGGSSPLVNSEGLPSIRQTLANGDVIITEVGPITLDSQTVAGNLIVNSLPIGVAEFTQVQTAPAITLNQANQFGGTLRFLTNLDGAKVVEAIPGIAQNGPQNISGLATLNANDGSILLDDPTNRFGSITFSSADVSIAEQDSTLLQSSRATGNFNLNSGGLVAQTGPLRVAGNTTITTDLAQAGTVRLRNQAATTLDTSLIGGNLTIDSGGLISQRPGSRLQVAGTTTILNPADNPGLDTSGNIIPRLDLPNGDVVITAVGPISLAPETFTGNLTVTSLAERLAFIDGVVYAAPAIRLDANNTFGGTIRFTTDAPTVVVESGTPRITQTGRIQVPDVADFTAENGTILLTDPNNTFGRLAFAGGSVSIQEGDDTDLLNSTATNQFSLTTNGAIAQNDAIVVNGSSQFQSLESNASISLNQSNQFSGPISLATVGQGDATVVNTLQNTELGRISVGGDLTLDSSGGITQSSPIQIAGMTTLSAGTQDILLPQANDFTQLAIIGGDQVEINDISHINLLESQVQGQLALNAAGDITTEDIESLGGTIRLNSREGSIDTTAGVLRSTLGREDGGVVNLTADQDLRLGAIDAAGQRGGQIRLIAGNLLRVVGDDITATTTGAGDGQGVLLRADTIQLLDGGRVLSQTSGSGRAGDMTIEARQFLIRNNLPPGPELTPDDFEGDEFTTDNFIRGEFTEQEFTGLGTNTNPESAGDGGDIRITVTERLEIIGNDSTPFNADPTDPESVLSVVNVPTGIISAAAGSGRSGDIVMDVGEFIMRDRAGMGSGPLLRDSEADVGGSITITADSVLLRNRAGIVTSSLGPGDASDLTLNVAQTLALERGGSIIADSPATTDGDAGDISITADQINLRSGGRIGTSTASAGEGGDLTISADVINVRGRAIATTTNSDQSLTPSGIFSSALVNSSAPAGNITVEVNTLNIRNGGEISASTAGVESAGDILIQGRDSGTGTIRIIGATDPTSNTQSSISTEARRRAQGDGGTIQLRNIETLTLQNNGNITARGRGENNAGNIRIDANVISLNQSNITAQTNSGEGGDIEIDANRMALAQSNITAQTNSGEGGDIEIDANRMALTQSNITAQTNSGEGGDIEIDANRMALNQSNITAQTNSGVGGTIGIDADTISLDQRSLITAETNTGEGGDLFITTNQLDVSGHSEISVESSEGLAGNVTINANGIVLDSGTISATTGRNAPDGRASANVILTGLGNNLFLSNGSLISADASLSSGAESNANAGNIIINAENGFIIASRFGNNDIIATAGAGNGGNITLTALRVFDLSERSGTREALTNNSTNDISASSLLGDDGVVSIDDLGLDPVQAAADLPADTAPPPLSQGCQPGMDGQGRFVNTAQGGILPSLDDPLGSDRGWEDVRPIAPISATRASESVLPDAIAEADGWHLNQQGQVALITVETTQSRVLGCPGQPEEQ